MKNNNMFLIAENTQADFGDYPEFMQEFYAMTGIRLDLYKERQMRRRINTRIARKGLPDYGAFLTRLKTDPAELASFIEYLTINVTAFFRTPDQWEVFEKQAMTDLVRRAEEPLKIWSCACSTGEEAYSLAMSFLRQTEPSHFHIFATDLDLAVLEEAREGRYSCKSMEAIPEQERLRFFVPQETEMQVTGELRSCVDFRQLDLLKDDYPQECDLIVCRNVLIYFTEEAKNAIYGKFAENLKSGGYLFTGNTEQIIYYKQFGLKKLAGYLYQKI